MLVILTFIQLPAQEESELLSLLWKLDEEMVTSLHKTIRSASMSGSKPCRKMINKELACRHGVEFLLGKVRLDSDLDLFKIRSKFPYLKHGSFRKWQLIRHPIIPWQHCDCWRFNRCHYLSQPQFLTGLQTGQWMMKDWRNCGTFCSWKMWMMRRRANQGGGSKAANQTKLAENLGNLAMQQGNQ